MPSIYPESFSFFPPRSSEIFHTVVPMMICTYPFIFLTDCYTSRQTSSVDIFLIISNSYRFWFAVFFLWSKRNIITSFAFLRPTNNCLFRISLPIRNNISSFSFPNLDLSSCYWPERRCNFPDKGLKLKEFSSIGRFLDCVDGGA